LACCKARSSVRLMTKFKFSSHFYRRAKKNWVRATELIFLFLISDANWGME
jgi:hypothetical protein